MTHRQTTSTVSAAPLAVIFMIFVSSASAQYVDYPETVGKTQPLFTHDIPSWATVDMELRGRTEAQTSINYMSGNAQIYELSRVWAGLEVRPTKWLSFYVQSHDDHALGLPLQYTAANMRDTFDLRQAYIKFHKRSVSVFGGRQHLKFGDQRLVGISDWTNVSRTFDGFDVRVGDNNRVDLFSAVLVNIYPTSFDTHSGGLNFHGAYGSIKTWIPRTTIEPCVLVKTMSVMTSRQGIRGSETEVTPGVRISDNVPGGLDYSLEGTLQRGSYSNESIHAGAGYVKLRYTFDHAPAKPAIQGEYDYATGNPQRNPKRNSTFDQQYPSSHNVFGLADLFGWQNIKQARINLYLEPRRNLTVLVQHEFLNLAAARDGIYSGSGEEFLMPPVGGFASNNIGRGFDAAMKYVYHEYFVVNAGVGHFSPGHALKANGYGAPLTITYVSFTYRFKLNRRENSQDQN